MFTRLSDKLSALIALFALFAPRVAAPATPALRSAGEERLLRLVPDELSTLRIATPGNLAVLRGRAWVTIDGELADHFVGRGESLALRPGSVVRIGGDDTGATLVRVTTPAPAPAGAVEAGRVARAARRLLEFDERLLRDIGAPESLIEAARAHRSDRHTAQAARRLEFLR